MNMRSCLRAAFLALAAVAAAGAHADPVELAVAPEECTDRGALRGTHTLIEVQALEISALPDGVSAPEEAGAGGFWGEIVLGDGPQRFGVLGVPRDEATAAVYVDANANRDLTDDGEPLVFSLSLRPLGQRIALNVTYAGGRTRPVPVLVFCLKEEPRLRLGYAVAERIRVELPLDTSRAARVTSPTANYAENLRGVVDLDGNGFADSFPDSPEWIDFTHPVTLGETAYRVAFAADGSTLRVAAGEPVDETGLFVGAKAPNWTVKSLATGEPVSLADFKGKVVFFDFWATWCALCREEIPYIAAAYERFKDQDAAIIGINNDANPEQVAAFQEQVSMPYLQLHSDDEAALRLYEVAAIPSTWLVSKDGRILAHNLRGPSIAAAIEQALAGEAIAPEQPLVEATQHRIMCALLDGRMDELMAELKQALNSEDQATRILAESFRARFEHVDRIAQSDPEMQDLADAYREAFGAPEPQAAAPTIPPAR